MHPYHFCLCVIFVALATPAQAADPQPIERPISDSESSIAVYTQGLGLASNGRAPLRLIVAAWPDGHTVWSEDQLQGGPPYHTGETHPARLEAALATIQRDGYFNDKQLAQPQFGPDARTTVIFARSKREQLKMQSWHELYEAAGKLVATDSGLSSLAGHARPDILRKASPDYLFFRVAWSDMRLLAASLIPAESKPVTGHLELREGKVIWIEQ